MDLTLVSGQLVSVIKAKLWKLVITCKNTIFPNVRVIFLKMCTFEVVFFFSASCLSNQLIFQSQYVFVRFIFLIEQSSSLLATIAMITEKMSFSCLFSWEPLLRKQIHLSQSSSLSTQTTSTLKNGSQTDKGYLKNCYKGVSSTPLLRTRVMTMSSKSSKITFQIFSKTCHNILLIKHDLFF